MPHKILVVDDEPTLLNTVRAYLRQEGYTVRTATDGEAGLREARVFQPDLLILDIMLPCLDGLELLRRLRQEPAYAHMRDVYVIMLTARADEMDKVIGLTLGADDYLTKPFSVRELVARVKAALRRFGYTGETGRRERDALVFQRLRILPGSR